MNVKRARHVNKYTGPSITPADVVSLVSKGRQRLINNTSALSAGTVRLVCSAQYQCPSISTRSTRCRQLPLSVGLSPTQLDLPVKVTIAFCLGHFIALYASSMSG